MAVEAIVPAHTYLNSDLINLANQIGVEIRMPIFHL